MFAGGGGGGGLIWVFSSTVDSSIKYSVNGGAGGTYMSGAAEDGDSGEVLEVGQCCDIAITQRIQVCGVSEYVNLGSCASCAMACSECLSAGTEYNPTTGPCVDCTLLDIFEHDCVVDCDEGQTRSSDSPAICQFKLSIPADTDISVLDASQLTIDGHGGGHLTNTVRVIFTTNVSLAAPETTPNEAGDWIVSNFDIRSIYFSDSPNITVSASILGSGGRMTATQFITLDIPREVSFDTPAYGAELNETLVTFGGTSTKPQVALKFLDSIGYSPDFYADTDLTGQWQIQVDLSDFAEGSIEVNARVVDSTGHTDDLLSFIYDLTPPDISITEPSDGSYVDNWVSVSGTTDLPSESVVAIVVSGLPNSIMATVTDGTFASFVDVSALEDGPFTLSVTATDPAGNSRSQQVTLNKDTGVPTISLTSVPAFVNTDNEVIFPIGGTTTQFAPGVEIEIQMGGVPLDPATVTGDGTFQVFVNTSTVPDGDFELVLYAEERAGKNATTSRFVTKDTSPPSLEVTEPSDNSYINIEDGGSLNVTGSVLDGETIDFMVDGQLADSIVLAGEQNFLRTIDLTTVADGEFDLVVVATDEAGNSQLVSIPLTKDTEPPVLSITSPINDDVINRNMASALRVRGSSDSLRLNLTFVGGTQSVTVDAVEVSGGLWSRMVDISSLQDGNVNLTATTTDEAGNIATDLVTLIMDTAPPLISITSPTDGSKITETNETGVLIRGTMSIDATSASLQIGGTSPEEVAVGEGFSFERDFSPYPNGPVEIIVTVVDAAGNEASDTVVIEKNSTTIGVNILNPSQDELFGIQSSSVLVLRGTSPGTSVSLELLSTTNASAQYRTDVDVSAEGEWSHAVNMTELGFPSGPVDLTATGATTAGISFIIDLDPPTLTVDTPAADSYINEVNIKSFLVNGTSQQVPIIVLFDDIPVESPDISGLNFSGTYELSSLVSSELVILTVSTADDADNVATVTRSLHVDVEPPTIAITSPDSGELIGRLDANLTVSGTSGDAYEITITLTDAVGSQLRDTLAGINPLWETSFDIASLRDGPVNVTAVAFDIAGNRAIQPRNFILDTTAPIVNWTNPMDYLNAEKAQSFQVIGTSDAPDQDVFFYAMNDLLAVETTDSNGSFSFSDVSVASYDDGALFLSVSITDLAGNIGTDSWVSVKATIPPFVVVTVPQNDSWIGADDARSVRFEGTTNGTLVTLKIATRPSVESEPDAGRWNFTADLLGDGPLADGQYNFTVSAEDDVGNVVVSNHTFRLDTTPPTMDIQEPVQDAVLGNPQLDVIATASEPITIHMVITVGNESMSGVFFSTSNIFVSLPFPHEGNGTAEFSIRDLAGNSANYTRNFAIDLTAPDLIIDEPIDSTYLNAQQDSFSVRGRSDAAYVLLDFDAQYNVSVVSGVFNYTLDASYIPDGASFNIRVLAQDVAGNQNISVLTVLRDTSIVAPVIQTPNPATVINAQSADEVLISGTSEETIVVLDVRGGLFRESSNLTVSEGLFAYRWNASDLQDGAYLIVANNTDPAGNSASSTINVTVDLTPPLVQLVLPQAGQFIFSSNVTQVQIEAITDDSGGQGEASLYVNGEFFQALRVRSGNVIKEFINLSSYPDGALNISVVISDPAENEQSASVNVTKDTVPDEVHVISPSNNTIVNSSSFFIRGNTTASTIRILVSSASRQPLFSDLYPVNPDWAVPIFIFVDQDLYISVSTISGNPSETSIWVTLDATPPSVALTSPAADAIYNGNGITQVRFAGVINSTRSSVAQLLVDNQNFSTIEITNGTFDSTLDLSGFADGELSLEIYVHDDPWFGNDTGVIILDTQAPVVTIEEPVDGQFLNRQDTYLGIIGRSDQPPNTLVTMTITDGSAIVARAVLRELQVQTLGDGSFQAAPAIESLPDGDLQLTVNIRDAAGNLFSQAVDLFKDSIAPLPGSIDPVAGDNVINIAEMASFSISGTGEPQAMVHLTLELSTSTRTRSNDTVMIGENGEWSYDFSFSTDSDGRLIITVVIEDEAGNESAPVSRSVTVDATQPTIIINPISFDDVITVSESNNVQVSGTAQVADGTPVDVVVRGSSGVAASSTPLVLGAQWRTALDLSAAPFGALTVTATAFSTNGNSGRAQRTITKQNDIPTATSTSTSTHTASPTSSASLSLGASPTSSTSRSASQSVSPSLSVGASPSSTNTPTPTRSETSSPSPTPSVTPSRSFINLVHAGSIPSSQPVLSASATRSQARPASPSASPAPCRDCEQTTVLDLSLSSDQLSEEDVTHDLTLPGEDRPVGSVTFPAGLLPPTLGDVTIRIEITRNNDPATKKAFAGDLVTDITIIDDTGAHITQFDDSLEICLSTSGLPEDDEDEKCLGYYDEERGRWICEDSCPKKDEETGQRCGSTDHLTSFALLLQGGARGNKNPCGDGDSYTLAWISLALVIAALLAVGVSVVLIEIRMRYKVYSQSVAFDAMSRRAESLANR